MASERKLRHSERKRLAETGGLGDYADAPPPRFRLALVHLMQGPGATIRRSHQNMLLAVQDEARRHFGWGPSEAPTSFVLTARNTDDLVDLIEILIEKCRDDYYTSSPGQAIRVLPDIERHVNDLCERHRWGYRFENGEGRKVSSPALDVEIVGPTLLAVARPGWEQAQRSFKEALDHQRGGETDDALTAAHAALEAAFKAVGLTGQFSTMVRESRNSESIPPYLRQVPEALDALLSLLGRSNAIRSAEGDAHGKAPGSDEVPQPLADLAIHLAGAFIVYLAETTSQGSPFRHVVLAAPEAAAAQGHMLSGCPDGTWPARLSRRLPAPSS
jgi:Abortive infection C-terminus